MEFIYIRSFLRHNANYKQFVRNKMIRIIPGDIIGSAVDNIKGIICILILPDSNRIFIYRKIIGKNIQYTARWIGCDTNFSTNILITSTYSPTISGICGLFEAKFKLPKYLKDSAKK